MPLSVDVLFVAAALVQAGTPSPVAARQRPDVQHAPPLTRDDRVPEEPEGSGPRGTSGRQGGDRVGYAAIGDGAGVTVTTADLPAGSIAEVTELDGGRIILAQVNGGSPPAGSIAALSPAAAAALGAGSAPVAIRLRPAAASAGEAAMLAAGQGAPGRMAAPPVLVTALRHRLPGRAATEEQTARALVPQPRRLPKPVRGAEPRDRLPVPPAAATMPARGLFVQIGALSNVDRARALAAQEHGGVLSSGGLHRVRIGPFATRGAAQSARDAAVRRGYAGAQIVVVPR